MVKYQTAAEYMASQYPCDQSTPEQRALLKSLREMWSYNNSLWLESAARKAIDVHIELMDHVDEKGDKIPQRTRLEAATRTLDHLAEMRKVSGIEERLTQLEDLAKTIKAS